MTTRSRRAHSSSRSDSKKSQPGRGPALGPGLSVRSPIYSARATKTHSFEGCVDPRHSATLFGEAQRGRLDEKAIGKG